MSRPGLRCQHGRVPFSLEISGHMASLVPLKPSGSAWLSMRRRVSRNSRFISLISLMRPTWMPFVFSLKHSLHEQDQIDQPDNQKRYRTVLYLYERIEP